MDPSDSNDNNGHNNRSHASFMLQQEQDHQLDNVLNGDLDEVVDSLIAADQAIRLSNLNDGM